MKVEAWSKVKAGDTLIYADEEDGVQKVKVVEVDITIESFDPTFKREQPYGLTADTGNLRIAWTANKVEHVIVENLANLIRFNLTDEVRLRAAYNEWQAYMVLEEAKKDLFISLRATMREK